MNIEEVWEKFNFLLGNREKQQFIADYEKSKKVVDEMTDIQRKELNKTAQDFVASLDVGYSFEERVKRQWKLLFLLKQTEKSEMEYLNDAKERLKKLKI